MFKWIYKLQKKLQEKLSEKGQGMTEYAIILAVVAVVAVAVFYGEGADSDKNAGLQGTISKAYKTASDQIDKVTKTTGDSGSGGVGSD